MTPVQVAAILAWRGEAWPYAPVSEGEARIWAEALRVEPDTGVREALAELTRTDSRPPTVARFREVRRAVGRAPRAGELILGQPLSARITDDSWHAGLAEARAALANSQPWSPSPPPVREPKGNK